MDDPYADVKEYFRDSGDVEVNEGRGSQGLKHDGRMFVMFLKGDLLVKLPPERIAQLVKAGRSEFYDPGTGSFMKDRTLIRQTEHDRWVDYCVESLEYVQ